MSKWYYHKQQDNKWTCMLYAHYICTRLTFLSIFLHHCIVHFSNRHVSKVILNTKRVLERRKTATLDKHTAERPDNIKTRHVKIIRYLQSWIAMSIDFEQQISHNAFRLLYARKSKPYSHAHTCATTRGLKWTEKKRIQIEVDFCMMLKYWKQCSVPIYPLHAAQVKPNASFKPIIILQ